MLEYTEATFEDLPRILDIYNQTIPTRMATADLKPVTVVDRMEWFNSHKKDHRPLLMVKSQDNVVGWVSLGDFYGRAAYDETVEISIYLDGAFQGNGFGKEILRHMEELAPKLGVTTFLAFVFGHNLPSQQLFLNHGYQRWGHLPQIAVMDGKKYDLDILGKSLI